MSPSSVFIVIGAIAFAVLSWVGTFYMLANLTGWRAMARRHPAVPPLPDADSGIGSVSFNSWGNYNNCVFWKSDDERLHLRLPVVFNLFHPPISLPWGEVEALIPIERGLRRGWVVLRTNGVSLTIPPKAAQRELMIRERLRAADAAGTPAEL